MLDGIISYLNQHFFNILNYHIIHLKRYIYILNFLFSVGLFNLSAQQDIQFSQYLNHQLIHNPATAGIDDGINLHALSRFQWLNLEGAPQSQALSAEIPVPYLKSGWGITLANSFEGAIRISNLHFVYAYHHKLQRETYISAGIGIGLQQQMLNTSKIITPEGVNNSESISFNDNLLDNDNISALAPSLNLGVLFRMKQLNIGLSFDGGIFSGFKYNELNTTISNPVKIAVQASYELEFNQQWRLIPNAQFKTSLIYNQLDLAVQSIWNDFIEFGLGFRGYNKTNIDALVGFVGVQVRKNVKVNYSYDYTISNFNYVSKGTHEIGIHYAIKPFKGKEKTIKKIYNTRYL